jgi:hypothetical protein
MKIGQKSFFGRIFDFLGKTDTENSNFVKFDFCTMFNRDTGLQSCKMTKKMDQKSEFDIWCFWVIRPWKTRISTRF